MIKFLVKDITTVERGVIAHGVNCQGAMGSGVAKAIRNKWPEVYNAYKQMPTGKPMLGATHIVDVSEHQNDTLFVANCYTQIFYGINGRFADPEAIRESLNDVYRWADYHDLNIYMPKIGCGLGGLNWEREVEPIVTELDMKWSRIDTFICEWG